jgi:hypothetical protein
MRTLPENTQKIDRDHSRWPDRHPRAKRRTCNLCAAGDRCGDHSPAAMRKADVR